MSTVPFVPNGYHQVQPYLMFKNCAEAIAFYTKVLGATERFSMKGPDGRIGHAEIQIGDSVIMMADENEPMQAFGPEHYHGSPVSIMVYVKDCDATYQQALAAGAKSLREPADQFYGDRMSGVLDPFGYKWWIATHIKDVSTEEMQAAAAQIKPS
ncbi:VOC family protein [Paracidobacterium acidisoli]|uniref:VOC family protein n=1 Tax=Paracidobacterium acidisoli TaxID=2303751 RepID=A0A372IS58_9BACT|nr:VOC family protein [Paracidobacterium acidisoli]MBT9330689.1 VOC family protein [Paracidobacterium acidisoli]